jgi:basic amino acid/polyamine antiporter, APA family
VPIVLPVLGLLSCIALAAQQEASVWLRAGLLLLLGLTLHAIARLAQRAGTRKAT